MTQPRRPFRNALPTRLGVVRRTGLLWTSAGLIVVALVATGVWSDLSGHAPPASDRVRAEPEHVAVVDGDTLRLDGREVRLAGVRAPDREDTCRGGGDCGGAATTALAGLVRNRLVECRLSGHDRLGRPYGDCHANGTDLSRAVVAAGWARAQPETPALADLELRARRQGAGLWGAATSQ